MKRRLWILLLMVPLVGYLATSFVVLKSRPEGEVCQGLSIMVADSLEARFVTAAQLQKMLHRAGLNPVGMILDSISCKSVEEQVLKNPFVQDAECYKSPSGRLCLLVNQRIPLLRVMDVRGGDYYVDRSGQFMPASGAGGAHVILVTGHVTDNLPEGFLYELGQFLLEDSFWKAQIQQVYVTASGDVELVPLVGSHIICLGKPHKLEEKLEKVKTFYAKVLSRIGWDKYSRIDVRFDNQIICGKND